MALKTRPPTVTQSTMSRRLNRLMEFIWFIKLVLKLTNIELAFTWWTFHIRWIHIWNTNGGYRTVFSHSIRLLILVGGLLTVPEFNNRNANQNMFWRSVTITFCLCHACIGYSVMNYNRLTLLRLSIDNSASLLIWFRNAINDSASFVVLSVIDYLSAFPFPLDSDLILPQSINCILPEW